MVKAKNTKHISADALTSKKASTKTKKDNPFEVHTNKEKFTIMGRQLKHDKGMPGVSRAKALKRRKDTLGQEYLKKHKTNSFRDRRIGEMTMTREEAASARFIAERLNQQKANKKEALFNLNDDDDDEAMLTHKGQTLGEIEQFADTFSDDDDDDEVIGKLDDEFTGVAHFGGGRSEQDGHDRKTAIDDLIADQKRRKKEITKEKEEVSELTHQLDENWKALIPLMAKMTKEDEKKPKPDDYDRALREMIFEPRGDVSDKLKSEEVLAKTEKQRLERLERERLERMSGVTEEEKKTKHRSADDLDDGYFMQPVTVETATVAYDLKDKTDADGDSDDEDLLLDAKQNGMDEEDDGEDEEEETEDDGSDDESDNLSDLKDTEDDEEEEEDASDDDDGHKVSATPADTPKTTAMSEQERREMIEKATAELPYTFELPDTYEELETLLNGRTAEIQAVILERMIKCNHPKILPENKPRMITLFSFLLQHINDTFALATPDSSAHCFRTLDRLYPFLDQLVQLNPAATTQAFKEVITEKQHDFRGAHCKRYPPLDTLVFLKLASHIFSTSDFRHPVITPCYVFISQTLSRCQVATRADIAAGLFLATVALEYAQQSKRFLPAVLNYLTGVVFLSVPKRPIEVFRVVPPFKAVGEQNALLALRAGGSAKKAPSSNQLRIHSADLLITTIDESAKVRLLHGAVNLMREALLLIDDNVGARYVVDHFAQYLHKLDMDAYPPAVRQSVHSCQTVMDTIRGKGMHFIVAAAKKPKALRMLEPKFEKVYDDKRTRGPGNKDKVVRDGMIRKIKSETRGAIREIRRDNVFLSKIQLKKQMHSDAERKEKVRRIFSEASIQQGELNAMDRKKKHL